MDDIRLDARAYDPAYVNEVMREARRMRNEVLVDLVKSLFDGRLLARLKGPAAARSHDLPHAAAPQG